MPTLASILSQVKLRAGRLERRLTERGDESGVSIAPTDADDALLTIYARQGAIELATRTGRAYHRAVIDVVQGTSSYDLGLSLYAPISAVFELDDPAEDEDAAYKLKVCSPGTVRPAVDVTSTEASPTQISYDGPSLHLYPVPDAAGTLRIYYLATSFIGEEDANFDTDELPAGDLVSAFPPELEKPLADYVLASWFSGIGEDGYAAGPMASFDDAAVRHMGEPKGPKVFTRRYRHPLS